MKKTPFILSLFCALIGIVVGEVSAKESSVIMFKQLSTADGLSNSSVRSLFRDSRGFLWIGTESGLNKYDGYTFKQYNQENSTLLKDAVQNMFEDLDGNVWMQSANGFCIYNYKSGLFENDYKPK